MPSIERELFGEVDGREVWRTTLRSDRGFCAKIIDYGAAVSELWVPDAKGETAPLDKPLSEHLKQNEGVLEPPRDMDSKIQKQAPVPNPNTTPVLPPPGEPGGDQSIQPK